MEHQITFHKDFLMFEKMSISTRIKFNIYIRNLSKMSDALQAKQYTYNL